MKLHTFFKTEDGRILHALPNGQEVVYTSCLEIADRFSSVVARIIARSDLKEARVTEEINGRERVFVIEPFSHIQKPYGSQ
jgi:hypothetical protein